MMNKDIVMVKLMAGWNGQILGGLITHKDMVESLRDQISGQVDMSADELDADMAMLMGWDIEDITEDQYRTWKDLVNQTAMEYIG